jgi:hypothetical protein
MLQEQQFVTILNSGPASDSLEPMIQRASETKQQAKEDFARHVETHTRLAAASVET